MRKPINNETQLINEIWNRANKELNERRQLSSPSIYDPLNLDPSKADHDAHVVEYLKSKANEPTKELPQDVDPDIARLAALDPKDQEQAYNLRRMVGFGAAAMADAPHGGWSEPEPEEEEDATEPATPKFDLAKKLGWNWEDIKKKAAEKKDAVPSAGDTIDVSDYKDGDVITIGIDLPKPKVTPVTGQDPFEAPHGQDDLGAMERDQAERFSKVPQPDWAKRLGWDWDTIKKNLKIPAATDEAKPEDVVIPAGGVHPGIIGGDAETQKAAAKATSQQRLPTIPFMRTKENDGFKPINYPEGTEPTKTPAWANPNPSTESKETGWMLSTPAQLAAQREKATPEQRKQVEDNASKLGVEPWSQEHLDAAQKSATENPAPSSTRTTTQTTSGRESGMGQGKTAVQPTRTWDEVAADHIPERFKDLPITRKDGKVYAGDIEMTAASQETENYAADAPTRKQLQEKLVVNQYCNFLSEMAKPRKQKQTPAGSDLFGSTETPAAKPVAEKPAAKPAAKPVAEKPAAKPAAKPATRKPTTKPGTTYKLQGDAPSAFSSTSQSYPFTREVPIPQGEKQLANYLGVHEPFGFNQQTSSTPTPKSSTPKSTTTVKRRSTDDNFSHIKNAGIITVGGPEQSVTPPPAKEPLAKRFVGAIKRNPSTTGVAALGLAGLLAIANNARTSQETPQPKTQVQDVVNTQDTPSRSPWGTPSAPKTEPNTGSGNFKPLSWKGSKR